jgi:hypothetical protein
MLLVIVIITNLQTCQVAVKIIPSSGLLVVHSRWHAHSGWLWLFSVQEAIKLSLGVEYLIVKLLLHWWNNHGGNLLLLLSWWLNLLVLLQEVVEVVHSVLVSH